MSLKQVFFDKLEEDICYWRDWGPTNPYSLGCANALSAIRDFVENHDNEGNRIFKEDENAD